MADMKNWQRFEEVAREIMSRRSGVKLVERQVPGVPKKFDMVSPDGEFVGDAKYLTLVQGKKLPPAKFMEISAHVWLLEKTSAKRRFLVFGNQREVPCLWLEKYGDLVHNIEFYFVNQEGQIEELNRSGTT